MKLVNFLKEEQSESPYVYAQCVLKILEEEKKSKGNCSAIIRFFYLIESCITLLYYRPHYILHTPSPRIGIAHTYVLSFRITYLICMYRVVNNCRVCVSKKMIKKGVL